MTVLYILGGLALAFVAFLALGLLHMRHSSRVAERAIEGVTLEQVPALRDECIAVFRSAFGSTLDLEDFEGAALELSCRLDESESLKAAFAKDDFFWYFVLPVGAFLGELIRVHVNGTWRESELGGLERAVPGGDESAQTFPFHKVIKHVTIGDPGDVYAYLESSRQLDKVVERLASEDPPAG